MAGVIIEGRLPRTTYFWAGVYSRDWDKATEVQIKMIAFTVSGEDPLSDEEVIIRGNNLARAELTPINGDWKFVCSAGKYLIQREIR